MILSRAYGSDAVQKRIEDQPKDSGGHTIIEVLIVLVVTGVLFVTAINIFGPRRGNAEFVQSMQDLASKIGTYVNQVNSESYPEAEGYTCDISSGKPYISGTGGQLGTSQSCIFLGRAFKVNLNDSTIDSYIVLGARNYTDAANQTHIVTDFDHANAAVAWNTGSGQVMFKSTYTLFAQPTILTSKVRDQNGVLTDKSLVGVYSDIGALSTPSGNAPLLIVAYPLPNPVPSPIENNVKNCVEYKTTSPTPCDAANVVGVSSSNPVTEWDLCIQAASVNKTALLQVARNATGIGTKIIYGGC